MKHDFWTGQDRLSMQFDDLTNAVRFASHGRLSSDIGYFMNHALTADTKDRLL